MTDHPSAQGEGIRTRLDIGEKVGCGVAWNALGSWPGHDSHTARCVHACGRNINPQTCLKQNLPVCLYIFGEAGILTDIC